MCVAFLALAGIATTQAAVPADSMSGLYCLRLSEESRTLCKLRGDEPPTARLRLASDGSFVLQTTLSHEKRERKGKFVRDEGRIVLDFGSSSLCPCEVHGPEIQINGLVFVRFEYSVAGSWTVWRNGQEDRSIKLSFGKDGSFIFNCPGARSSGKYVLDGNHLSLLYTKVDDEDVPLGTMKKEIVLSDDGSSYDIDVYHYSRATD